MKIDGNVTIPEAVIQGTPNFVAITPADATVLSLIRGLYIGGAGTVLAKNVSGQVVTFTCVAGQKLDIAPIAIMTASTATGIVALMA
jgi:hypothetical protein